MSVWSWLKLTVFLWLLRKMIKGTGWLLLAALAVAVWPVTLVTVTGYAAAWLRGWPPVRLGRAAAAALPTTVIWLVAEGARQHAWQAIALAPVRDWAHGWHHLTAIGVTRTFLLVAPVAIPAGLGLAALLWGWRIYALTTGIGGWLASAPITFDARQWKRQVRTAQGWTAAPGSVPLLARGARIPVGGTIRVIGHRWHPVFTVPHAACARHMVIVGATGSGKTNLMMRLWAGWFTAALAAARAGRDGRPLLVVLDCKGGPDARTKANRTRRLLYGAGARRVAIWPDEARLSLWGLPPNDLAVLLYQMIDSGTGAAAYYADILQAVLTLAIMAPGGPPLNAAAFTDRLDVRWLQRAWGDGLARGGAGPGARRGPAPARHPAPVRHPARPARPGAGRTGDPGRRRRVVLHPGRHPRAVGRRGPGHGHHRTGRVRGHRPGQRAAGDAAGRRRLQRRVPPGAPVQPVRTRPVPGHRRAGLRPDLAGPGPG